MDFIGSVHSVGEKKVKYKLSKSEVFEKVIPAADFCVSADDMCKQVALLSQRGRAMLRVCQ